MASCIPLTKMVQQMNLKNVTPEIDISQIKVHVPDINRPALQLTGYFDHFAYERVQIVGYVEYTYLLGIPMEQNFPFMRSLYRSRYRVLYLHPRQNRIRNC